MKTYSFNRFRYHRSSLRNLDNHIIWIKKPFLARNDDVTDIVLLLLLLKTCTYNEIRKQIPQEQNFFVKLFIDFLVNFCASFRHFSKS